MFGRKCCIFHVFKIIESELNLFVCVPKVGDCEFCRNMTEIPLSLNVYFCEVVSVNIVKSLKKSFSIFESFC